MMSLLASLPHEQLAFASPLRGEFDLCGNAERTRSSSVGHGWVRGLGEAAGKAMFKGGRTTSLHSRVSYRSWVARDLEF